jgi:hypothetical protein
MSPKALRADGEEEATPREEKVPSILRGDTPVDPPGLRRAAPLVRTRRQGMKKNIENC